MEGSGWGGKGGEVIGLSQKFIDQLKYKQGKGRKHRKQRKVGKVNLNQLYIAK